MELVIVTPATCASGSAEILMCKDDIRVFIVPGKSVSVNNFGQFPGLSVFHYAHNPYSTQVRITQTIL